MREDMMNKLLLFAAAVFLLSGCLDDEPESVMLDRGEYSDILDDIKTQWPIDNQLELTDKEWNDFRSHAHLAIVGDGGYVKYCQRCAEGDEGCLEDYPFPYRGCCFDVLNDKYFIIVHESEDAVSHVIHEALQHFNMAPQLLPGILAGIMDMITQS